MQFNSQRKQEYHGNRESVPVTLIGGGSRPVLEQSTSKGPKMNRLCIRSKNTKLAESFHVADFTDFCYSQREPTPPTKRVLISYKGVFGCVCVQWVYCPRSLGLLTVSPLRHGVTVAKDLAMTTSQSHDRYCAIATKLLTVAIPGSMLRACRVLRMRPSLRKNFSLTYMGFALCLSAFWYAYYPEASDM